MSKIKLYKIKKNHYGILTVHHVGKDDDQPKLPSYLHAAGERYDSLEAAVEAMPTMFTQAEEVVSEEVYKATCDLDGDELAEAVGAKTLTDLHRVAKALTLIERDGEVEIIPTKRVNRGYILFEEHTNEKVALSDQEGLIAALERALEKAINLKEWNSATSSPQ